MRTCLLLLMMTVLAGIAPEIAESNDAPSESHDATSESNDATSESNDAPSESNDATSESNDATSESSDATSESNDATSESNDAPSESNDATSESHDAPSESTDATFESNDATSASNDATSESIIEAFLYLLNLTDVTCDGFEWCTVRKENVAIYRKTTHFYFGGCCSACSCEPTCMAKLTCCPDYKLKSYFNGNIYTNVSNLISAIEEIPRVEELSIRLDTGDSTSHTNDTLTTKCVSADMNCLSSKTGHMGSFYHMVSTCTNETVSSERRTRCNLNETNLSKADLDDIRPVQSLVSGVVYRNIYCLFCSLESPHPVSYKDIWSETESLYEKWDVFVSDRAVPITALIGSPKSYRAIVEYLFAQYSSGINIHFEPSDSIRLKYPPRSCLGVDDDSCNSETNMDSQIACQWFSLPLYIWERSRKTHIIYNNAACLNCNNVKLTGRHSICSSYQHAPRHLFLGKLTNEILENVDRNMSQIEEVGILNMAMSPLQCQKGFVYDNAQGLCRQLFCPCGMVAYEFKCRPVFETIAGKDVELYVSVTRQTPLANHLTDEEYVNALVDYFDEQFKAGEYVSLDVIIIGKSSGAKLQTTEHAVYIVLKKHGVGFDFLAVVRKIGKVARGMKHIVVGANENSVHMAVADSMRLLQGQLQNHVHMAKYTTVYSRQNHSKLIAGNSLPITSCFFCYRVELWDDEFTVKADTIFLRNVRKRVSQFSLTTELDTGKHMICSNELLDHRSHSDVEVDDTSLISGDVYGSTDNFAEEYTFLTAAAAIALILIVTCLVKHACKKGLNSTVTLEQEAPI